MSETMDQSPAEQPDDIRSAIEQAFEQHETAQSDQPRDERGRFAQKAAEAAAAAAETPDAPEEPETAEAPPEEPEAPTETPEGEEKVEQPAKTAEPPATWRAADKEMFGKIPPEAQEFLLRRHGEMEADYTRKNMQRAALIRDYEPIRQMFEPHAETMRQKGITPSGLIQGWYNAETALMDARQAPALVANIIKGYNVDPQSVFRALGYQIPAAQDGEPPPPAAASSTTLPPEVQQVLQHVVNRVETFEQQQRRQQQEQMAQAASRVESEIKRFAQETDASGAPLRPYFSEVEDEMALIADSYTRKGGDIPPLQELYEAAVWANPITRARVQQDMTAAAEAQRVAADRKRAEEARARSARAQRAAAPVTGAPRTGLGDPRETSELSLRQQLERAFEEANNG